MSSSSIDQTGRFIVWPWLTLGLYFLVGEFGLADQFAWPWLLGRSDVLTWWVVDGFWKGAGWSALFIASLACTAAYSHLRASPPKGMEVAIGLGCLMVALTCLTFNARGRVELRASDIRLVPEDWRQPDLTYRAEYASRMIVSCTNGRRGKIYPSIEVLFFDGTTIELERLVSRRANRPNERYGLAMAERLDSFLSARGNRYVSAEYDIEERCVRRVSRRLGTSLASRVGRLFRS